MKFSTLSFAALLAFAGPAGSEVRADNMATFAVSPASGAVTLVPRWATGGDLAGFHHMAQDLSVGGGANQFYSIKGTAIPSGGDVSAFSRYIAASGATTAHADIGSKLTPNSYSALTSADPDVGYGAVNLYFIHHKDSGDYFTAIVPSSAVASAVTDLKPMSGPGGPATLGGKGYFGLTFAAANIGYGLNQFYYLRSDPSTGYGIFGAMDPGLAGISADKFNLGVAGFKALAFSGADVGFGVNQMYYLRLDPVTGFTIFGTLHPVSGRASDVANLGSVYSALTFVPGDLGFGPAQFYTTGAVNPTWQSVSFAALADRAISAGSFTVTPSASSNLPITLTVVAGSIGSASISAPVAGVFTVTPTAPGLITLQATQAGQAAPAFEYNMLRQSFTATGTALLAITTQPLAQNTAAGGTATFTTAATGASAVTYQWRKDSVALTGNVSATTATLTLANVQAANAGSYDVMVTNTSGTITSDAVVLTVTASTTPTTGPAGSPVISSATAPATATAGLAFTYTIVATGSPTGFTASPLPAGIVLNTTTGVLSGTPTTAGTTTVVLTATNATGTGTSSTLTITVAAAPTNAVVAPTIVTQPVGQTTSVDGTVTLTAAASGSPTPTYQWYRNGVLITGATNASLTITSVQAADGGVYTTTVTNSGGTVTTEPVTLVAAWHRIVNFAARAISGPGDQSLIMGFVVSGDNKSLLVRGVGPGLATYGISNVLADPMLTLYNANQSVATNDNWQIDSNGQNQGSSLATIATQVGAFPLLDGSKDSALLVTVNRGAHTTGLLRPNSTTGTALTEIYDTDRLSGARLTNVAARMHVSHGDGALIGGFVLAGNTSSSVLIRSVGPGLTAYGVSGVLADPQISVYSGTTLVASNDNWESGASTTTQLNTAFTQVGAFPLTGASKDACLLLTLAPGAYTVIVTGVGSTTGVALVEVYDLQ